MREGGRKSPYDSAESFAEETQNTPGGGAVVKK
jgi:hypothetical protein